MQRFYQTTIILKALRRYRSARLLVIFAAIFLTQTIDLPAAENTILSLANSDLPAYIQTLRFETHRDYDVSRLYLLYRKLEEDKEFQKAQVVLDSLDQSADWSVKPIVTVEKINGYLKREDPSGMLVFLAEPAKIPESGLFEEPIFRALRNEFSQIADPKMIQKALQQLLPAFNKWRQDPEFIVWALEQIDGKDSLTADLVLQLWVVSDVEKFPASYIPYLDALKKDLPAHQEMVMDHFFNQYRLKNWSYVIATAPQYLNGLSPESKAFQKIREVYFKTFFRQQAYSQLIELLNSSDDSRQFYITMDEKATLLFRLWLKKGHVENATAYLKQLEEIGPANVLAGKYFELAEFLYERKQYDQSLVFYDLIAPGAHSEELIPIVQWRKLRIYDLLKNPREMAAIARWADNYPFQSPEVAAKFCYWGVKLKLYDQRSHLSCYQRYPMTYYGFRALFLEPTRADIANTIQATSSEIEKRDLTSDERVFLDFIHVLYLSDETEIADALVMRYFKQKTDMTFFSHLADILFRAERYYLQQLLVELHFREALKDATGDENPLLTAYYPAGYRKEVARHIGLSRMPQMLVFAVIREESNFRADVASSAGAVGLMQLMPSTAEYVANIIRTPYDPTQLNLPDVNVKLGVAYLKRLLRRFKGNLYYTLAAYNGGATNVNRWIRNAGTQDFDVFVEAITFNETQDYVKRVIRSYYIYQMLYGQRIPMDNPDLSGVYPAGMSTETGAYQEIGSRE
ncbi:lytic transglycosylase domain-containing protein [bacterium]|nr:lytic transglycosylase domain-containing protein [bacterium]